MAITSVNLVSVMCDDCDEYLWPVASEMTKVAAAKEARKEGWSVGETVKCPSCKKGLPQ